MTKDIVCSDSFQIGQKIDSAPAKRPQHTILKGRHIVIVPLDPSMHARTLYDLSHGDGKEHLWRYLFEGPFPDRGSFESELRKKTDSQDPLFFTIIDRTTGVAVGYAAYMRIKPVHRVIEIGSILYTPSLQRSTGATEAMYLMARHVFEELGYRRYEWKCDAFNAPSRSAALRLGFSFEGTFRQHMIIKGRNRDTAWYSMLDSEWPDRKARFERWLDPSNFDAGGKQKTHLSHP